MQSFNECFLKVKTDCFRFISSQETKTEKFKNKGRMIRSFLIPICFWISKKASKKKPLIIGLAGGQGIGKTTITSIITIILKKYFKLNAFKISIDDFYKTRKERKLLSKNNHPLLMTRGAPGTHDIDLMLHFFKKIQTMRTKKGNIENIAILAGIMGAKDTSRIIPLCHNIPINHINIDITQLEKSNSLKVTSEVMTNAKTGVEMEALVAVSISCLTIYDMCKNLSKDILIKSIKLISKSGGNSDYDLD